MPTPAERKALVFFGAVALLGVGVRVERARRPAPQATVAERAALQRQIARVDSARRENRTGSGQRSRARDMLPPPRQPRVISPGLIDVDRATAAELERLPRICPKLAATIVADREKLGPFGSLEGLERVKGIGPAMASQLDTLVRFSGQPRVRPASAKKPPVRR